MTSTSNDIPTGATPVITASPADPDRPRGGWISDPRETGRHRVGRTGSVHVSAIRGVQLARKPQRRSVGAMARPAPSLLARLLGAST